MRRPVYRKYNRTSYPDALLREAEGLAALAEAATGSGLRVPGVWAVGEDVLDMDAIDAVPATPAHGARVGAGLAALHRRCQPAYGWQRDNYIGLNPQFNTLDENWGRFFVDYRLYPQLRGLAEVSLRRELKARLDSKRGLLIEFLSAHCGHPSLVHGDLWAGNVLCDPGGGVWLIDPAVYWGDREVDLAMSEMFGGFPAAFYRAYDATLPRSSGYPVKRDIYNLYHYLNHYRLFGNAYRGGCEVGMAAISGL